MSPLKTFPKSYNSRAPLLPLHSPNTGSLDYYCIRLEDQLTKLKTEDVFAAMRNETPLVVREFAEKTLLGLSLFSSEKPTAMTFTHYDSLPHNILVSESSPPLVAGILDFEFAGFFPNEEEFTNNATANSDDWPEEAYRVFLEELEGLRERTPTRYQPGIVERGLRACADH